MDIKTTTTTTSHYNPNGDLLSKSITVVEERNESLPDIPFLPNVLQFPVKPRPKFTLTEYARTTTPRTFDYEV